MPFENYSCTARIFPCLPQQKSRRGTDHWSDSLAARLAWRSPATAPWLCATVFRRLYSGQRAARNSCHVACHSRLRAHARRTIVETRSTRSGHANCPQEIHILIGNFRIGCSDGRCGIRTHGTLLTYTHFPGVRLKPLGHPSQHRTYAQAIGTSPNAGGPDD